MARKGGRFLRLASSGGPDRGTLKGRDGADTIRPYQPGEAMNERSASPGPEASSRGLHLDSWKEIAAYLKRDIRTVQRWEKREGLPVHRHQHDERGTAYAYSAEIDSWLEARSQRSNGDSTEATAPSGPGSADYGSAEAASTNESQSGSSPAAAVVNRRLTWALLGIASAALLIAAVTFWRSQPDLPVRPLTTLSIVFPASQRVQEWGPDMALSPDGASLLYTARGATRLRRLDELEARILSDKGLTFWGPFFSPDGKQVGFFEPGKLLRVSVDGGTPVTVADIEVDFVGGANWGSHDHIVFGAPTPEGSHGLYRVPATGGRPQLIATTDDNETYWLTPQWIDNGNAVLCTVVRTSPDGPRFQVVAVSVATGQRRLLIDDGLHGFDAGGMLVYWRNDALFATKFDSRRLEITGPHVPAWDNVGPRTRNRSWAQAGDTLVYWPKLRTMRQLAWIDRDGREEQLRLPAGDYKSPRLSPDGLRMAVIIEGASSEFGDLWIHDLASGANLQLTRGGQTITSLWTADGRHLIVSMRQGGSSDLYRVQSDGRGEPEPLDYPPGFLTGAFKEPAGWGPEGDLILRQWGANRQPRLWVLNLENDVTPRAISTNSTSGSDYFLYATTSVSADGRWIAFSSAETGRAEVYVAPLPEGRPKWRVSSEGGVLPVWARSGRELFYRSGTRMMAVPVSTKGGFTPGEARRLFDVELYQVDPGEPHYDVSLEDRFLVVKRGTPDGPERLNVVQGWRSEIERRLQNAR